MKLTLHDLLDIVTVIWPALLICSLTFYYVIFCYPTHPIITAFVGMFFAIAGNAGWIVFIKGHET